MIKSRLVVVTDKKKLPIQGGIYGPISVPSELKQSDIIKLVNLQYNVYAVNPADTSKRVKLTINNLDSENLFINELAKVQIAAQVMENKKNISTVLNNIHEAESFARYEEEQNKAIAEYVYNKDGSYYKAEGEAYNQYDKDDNLIKCGITTNDIDKLVESGEASFTKFNERPEPNTEYKKSSKKNKKKNPRPTDFSN